MKLVVSICTFLLLAACSVNPVTGKQEFSLLSSQQEIQIGIKNYGPSRQAQGGDYYIDPSLQDYVSKVGTKLAALSDQPNLPYEFIVLNNDMPNAWALPGGKIAINRGLLTYLDDESQLAAVLSHEIVHAAARHGAAQMTRGSLANLGMMVVDVGAQNKQNSQIYNSMTQLGAAAWMSKYGRDDELESDYYGMKYMARAGYALEGAVELQETFLSLSKKKKVGFINGLFASHPPSQNRVIANRARAQNFSGGLRYRDRYQTAIRQLLKDAPAYDYANDARSELKNKNPKKALLALDSAVAIQSDEFSFWLMRGKAWKMLENKNNAVLAFSTSIKKNPSHFSAYLERGMLLYDNGNRLKGIADIQKSYELLPTSASSYYLGRWEMENNNYSNAVVYYRQAIEAPGKFSGLSGEQLVLAEQKLNPKSFLLGILVVRESADLVVQLTNLATVPMINIEVQVSDGRTVNSLRWNKKINAKGSVLIKSGFTVGLADSGKRTFQVKVIRASIFN